jgi:hypothetical protein
MNMEINEKILIKFFPVPRFLTLPHPHPHPVPVTALALIDQTFVVAPFTFHG